MGFENLFARRREVKENAETNLEGALALYKEFNQPVPTGQYLENLKAYLEKGNTLRMLRSLHIDIRSAWMGGPLSVDFLRYSAELGLTNLTGAKFSGRGPNDDSEINNARGLNLKGFNLNETQFESLDLNDTDFTDAILNRTKFYQSILNTATIDSITLNAQKIDLLKNQISISDDSIWQLEKPFQYMVDNCMSAEDYNLAILDPQDRQSRKGILFFQDGQPLGYLKLKGESSFLALRTVRDSKGQAIFWKGMIYALDSDPGDVLFEMSHKYRNETSWRRVDLERLREFITAQGKEWKGISRNNLRFATNPVLFERMDELTQKIDAGEEPMIDLIPEAAIQSPYYE